MALSALQNIKSRILDVSQALNVFRFRYGLVSSVSVSVAPVDNLYLSVGIGWLSTLLQFS